MPDDVRDIFGYALHLAQLGCKHSHAKAISGFGDAGILEVVEDHQGETYRAVYTVRHATAVYVLHCFQKKSKHGVATPKKDMNLIAARLKTVATFVKDSQKMNTSPIDHIALEKGSGNPYADIGLPDAEEMLLKSEVVQEIERVIQSRHLTHRRAAELLGMPQAKLSDLLLGKFRTTSRDHLIECLNRLQLSV